MRAGEIESLPARLEARLGLPVGTGCGGGAVTEGHTQSNVIPAQPAPAEAGIHLTCKAMPIAMSCAPVGAMHR